MLTHDASQHTLVSMPMMPTAQSWPGDNGDTTGGGGGGGGDSAGGESTHTSQLAGVTLQLLSPRELSQLSLEEPRQLAGSQTLPFAFAVVAGRQSSPLHPSRPSVLAQQAHRSVMV